MGSSNALWVAGCGEGSTWVLLAPSRERLRIWSVLACLLSMSPFTNRFYPKILLFLNVMFLRALQKPMEGGRELKGQGKASGVSFSLPFLLVHRMVY